MTIRIIKTWPCHKPAALRFVFLMDDRVYFYWDDVASRRLSANQMDGGPALEAAKARAKAKRDKEP
jgi:hypothetical protein